MDKFTWTNQFDPEERPVTNPSHPNWHRLRHPTTPRDKAWRTNISRAWQDKRGHWNENDPSSYVNSWITSCL